MRAYLAQRPYERRALARRSKPRRPPRGPPRGPPRAVESAVLKHLTIGAAACYLGSGRRHCLLSLDRSAHQAGAVPRASIAGVEHVAATGKRPQSAGGVSRDLHGVLPGPSLGGCAVLQTPGRLYGGKMNVCEPAFRSATDVYTPILTKVGCVSRVYVRNLLTICHHESDERSRSWRCF